MYFLYILVKYFACYFQFLLQIYVFLYNVIFMEMNKLNKIELSS